LDLDEKNRKQKIGTAQMNFLRSLAGYKRTDQIRNSKTREELNIFNKMIKF
jgi:hypothetical protein